MARSNSNAIPENDFSPSSTLTSNQASSPLSQPQPVRIKTLSDIKSIFGKSQLPKSEAMSEIQEVPESEMKIDKLQGYNSLDQGEVSEILEFVDTLWDMKDKPDQAKLIYQSIARYK